MIKSVSDISDLQQDVAYNRNQLSYRQLFLHFYAPALRFTLSFVKSKEVAEEIYDDVFLKLWELGAALANINNLEAFIFVSLKNAALNYLSKHYKIRILNIDDIPTDFWHSADAPDQFLRYSELEKAQMKAIHDLPAKCQLVYKMVKDEGFSYRQTAEILSISVNTVEGHMTTALKKLSAALLPFLTK